MIRKRLKKSSKEEAQKFARMMEEEHVTFRERLVMILTAYVVLLLPSILILIALALFSLWLFGVL